MAVERPLVRFTDADEAAAWFAEHHDDCDGIFIAIAKKGGSVPTPTYDELMEQALIYGWIDSLTRRLDDDCFQVTFTPRRSRSPWSQVNREKAEVLMAAGRMHAAGLAAVEQAKTNGRWESAYARSSETEVPADFLEALERNPAAKAFFATLNKHNVFAVYYRLNDAKRPETRQRRIDKFVDMFARGEKIH